jgi:hypothetical protein
MTPDSPHSNLTVDDLCSMLTSPDPTVRDDIAYATLARRVGRGDLDGSLARLGDDMAAMLGHSQIQARTFATLILGAAIRRDAVTGELTDPTVARWRDAFVLWWAGEADLRGYDDELGWLHAIAHGADTVRALGASTRLDAADLTGLLELVADRLLAPTDYLFAHGEDDRLAYALATVLARPELTSEATTSWTTRIYSALVAGQPGPVPSWAANAIRTLNALYVAVDRGVCAFAVDSGARGPVVVAQHRAGILFAVAEVLRDPNAYLG